MVIAHLSRGKASLAGLAIGAFSLLITALAPAVPAHAASNVQIDWTGATSVRFSGSALSSPIDVNGNFVGGVVGAPAGAQAFMASSSGPVTMSFGCKVSLTLDVFPDASGNLDYSKGELVFTTSSPSTCSQDTLKANINGLVHDPNTGAASLSLENTPIGSVDKRGPSGGNDSPDKQIVNVTAGMGAASNYNNIPQTDVFLLCEAKGDYANKLDVLTTDCLAKKASALSAPPLTSHNLETLKDKKGPGSGDEKGWTGQFTNVTAGTYMVCSTNFKACQLFGKNPGQIYDAYIIYGSTPGSVIPGTPPGQGDDQKVCTTGDGLVGALAWILCPAIQLIATATQFFENNIIIPFLTTSPLTTNADNPVYILWQDVRNFANIGFILFFFVVIFSQATSIGLSNYGIKRILPRMGLVVVGVNLSYFGAAIVLDAFNIFGAGVSQLVTAALQQAGTQQLNTGSSAGPLQMFALGGAALVTVVATGGAAIGWFFSFLGLAFLVVVAAVGILMVRQYYLLGIVIASPLLVLALMLPNLASGAKKQITRGIKVAAMYPSIVLLFALGDILGFILSQPDFKLTGSGVNDDVAQAIRVILQFIARVLPLTLLPAAFAATGTALDGVGNWAGKKFIQPRANRLREDASQMAGEARMRLARRTQKIPVVGGLTGMGMRRNYVREQRRRNLEREQEEYVAGAVGSSAWMRRRAAGVSGQAGQTRAAAYAANTAAKGRNEDIDAEMALLNDEMRRIGMDQKSFAAATGKYLQDPNVVANQKITGANGETFDFKANAPRLQRALLNSAASQGEVGAIEAARLNNSDEDYQTMLDDIIRRNDGKLKEKGGYHLATNFKLAGGRDFDLSTPAGVEAAKTEMLQQRFGAMANSGANSIAGMKGGVLGNTADMVNLATGPAPGAGASPAEIEKYNVAFKAFHGMNPTDRQKMFDRFDEIVKNPNTLNRSEGAGPLRDMHTVMTSMGYIHS